MAGTSNIDIMGSLNDALSAITGSKTDLSFDAETSPFAEQAARIKANQELADKLSAIQKLNAERALQIGNNFEQADAFAPFRSRISSRIRKRK